MRIYEVIKEYPSYYLCKSQKGYNECFSKPMYKPNEKGQIHESEGNTNPPEKVHRAFNGGKFLGSNF